MNRIVLGYSGSVDTLFAIPRLKERYDADVVAVTLDFGQGHELEDVRNRALAAGAARAHVLDVREEFARDYLLRVLRADALIATAGTLAFPLIARKLTEMAAIEDASAIAHGSVGMSPIDELLRALGPQMTVEAPVRDTAMSAASRREYARARGLAVDAAAGHTPADPRADGLRSREPATVQIAFERGVPLGINGIAMPLLELLASLDVIAAPHGIQRVERVVATALRALQNAFNTPEIASVSRAVSAAYVGVVESGSWFTFFREALDAYVDRIQEHTSGVVGLRLGEGLCQVIQVSVGNPATSIISHSLPVTVAGLSL